MKQHIYSMCAHRCACACALAHMAYAGLECVGNDWSVSLNQMAHEGDILFISIPRMLGACVELTQRLGQEVLEP